MVGSRVNRLPPGIPGLLYLEFIGYGRGTQMHVEKMVHLEKAYAYERGYLPAYYEKKKKVTDYEEAVLPLLKDVLAQIEAMNNKYNPAFEGLSRNPEEKEFIKIMRGVFERLVYIAAFTEMIDTQNPEEALEV